VNFRDILVADYLQNLGIKNPDQETQKKYASLIKEYHRVGLICLTELISTLYHFNFKREIVDLITIQLRNKDDEMRNIVAKVTNDFFEDNNPGTCKSDYFS
jgi:hypothetical protein